MKTPLRIFAILAAAAVIAAPSLLYAGDARDSMGDPARWSQPIETPRQMYENTLKEARNALADAIQECRASGADRKACEAQARRQYESDVAAAKKSLGAR